MLREVESSGKTISLDFKLMTSMAGGPEIGDFGLLTRASEFMNGSWGLVWGRGAGGGGGGREGLKKADLGGGRLKRYCLQDKAILEYGGVHVETGQPASSVVKPSKRKGLSSTWLLNPCLGASKSEQQPLTSAQRKSLYRWELPLHPRGLGRASASPCPDSLRGLCLRPQGEREASRFADSARFSKWLENGTKPHQTSSGEGRCFPPSLWGGADPS